MRKLYRLNIHPEKRKIILKVIHIKKKITEVNEIHSHDFYNVIMFRNSQTRRKIARKINNRIAQQSSHQGHINNFG